MAPSSPTPKDFDAYFAGFPPEVQKHLQEIRTTIQDAVPEAEEAIRYKMPTFLYQGILISFAAYDSHIGIYPVPAGTQDFQTKIASYRSGKSTLRLPLDQPIPYELIREMVTYRAQEHLAKKKK